MTAMSCDVDQPGRAPAPQADRARGGRPVTLADVAATQLGREFRKSYHSPVGKQCRLGRPDLCYHDE